MDDLWFSVGEIAEYLGTGKDTVYGRITNNGLPGLCIGPLLEFRAIRPRRAGPPGKAEDEEPHEYDE